MYTGVANLHSIKKKTSFSPSTGKMPKSFVRCVDNGGRVRTVHTSRGTCIRVCFDKGNGKSHAGESFKCKPVPRVPKSKR